jgi:hypothetical protein
MIANVMQAVILVGFVFCAVTFIGTIIVVLRGDK